MSGCCENAGLETSTWREMSESPPERVSQPEPTERAQVWLATRRQQEEQFHAAHREELPPPDSAFLRSQCGPLASAALTALPNCRATLIESQPFRVWLCWPSSPHPSHLPLLPMWPPTGQVWPPSRRLFKGGGVGDERFPVGVHR